MSYAGAAGTEDTSLGRGSRRRKIAGYLRAANELRQSYQGTRNTDSDDEAANVPGAFPDLKVSQNGTDELVLFPSYAKRHTRKTEGQPLAGIGGDDLRRNAGPGDAEYWKKEWEIYEDANAVVDVDVRGWIYTPQKGPMNRKNRLMMGIARRLSGIPVPNQGSQSNSRSSSVAPPRGDRQEDEMAEREARYILQRGEQEADVAGRGGYSEEPTRMNSDLSSRSASPRPGQVVHPVTQTSLEGPADSADLAQTKWPQPAEMSREELAAANTHLLTRIKPFMSTPVVGMALTIFFFNDKTSQSRTTRTNESGHFNFRAALSFVPTSIRVLASESLSATESVEVIEPRGISMISDIDDTVKHSAIGGRAKDIFLNIFVRELDSLTIQGVDKWYHRMAKLGVKIHYVSNSPWQMFPLLNSFFTRAKLPPGSYHLKAYSGMFQGVFEPVAERKRGTIDRLLQDFPERRFILVGDSGEADLEVYTETALMNPGRILGIFIRDITTTPKPSLFEPSLQSSRYRENRPASDPSLRQSIAGNTGLGGKAPHRPPLPPRPLTGAPLPSSASDIGDLIDLSEDPQPSPPRRAGTDPVDVYGRPPLSKTRTNPPPPPAKPLALRTKSNEMRTISSFDGSGSDQILALQSERSDTSTASFTKRKAIPPAPPKPRKLSASQIQKDMDAQKQEQVNGGAGTPSTQSRITAAYNMLPSPSLPWSHGPSGSGSRSQRSSTSSTSSAADASDAAKNPAPKKKAVPPLPPRRKAGRVSATQAAITTREALPAAVGSWRDSLSSHSPSASPPPPIDRRVDMWQRRWARAEAALKPKGIMLMAWRVGEDAQDAAEQLVRQELDDMG